MLYALVANDCSFAVDLFATRQLADQALRDALDDVPEWSELLSVVEVPVREPALNPN